MSGRVEALGLVRTYPAAVGLAGLDLVVEPGEHMCVLGPSGCGKSTLLRVLAGLDAPDAGELWIDGVSMAGVGPATRPTAIVFQTDALFPDMTVADNVAFGLRCGGRRRADADRAAEVTMVRLGVSGLARRYPNELSGGQRRLVALARALAVSPAVLLLDEPLTGLEEGLRSQLVRQIRDHQDRFGLTVLHVTHAVAEAMALADRVAVMSAGKVVQVGTPREAHDRPDSVFVAEFMGEANLIWVRILAETGPGRRRVRVFGAEAEVAAHPGVRGEGGVLAVRPGAIRLRPSEPPPEWATLSGAAGRVVERRYEGDKTRLRVETADGSVLAWRDPDAPIDEFVEVGFDPGRAWLLPVG